MLFTKVAYAFRGITTDLDTGKRTSCKKSNNLHTRLMKATLIWCHPNLSQFRLAEVWATHLHNHFLNVLESWHKICITPPWTSAAEWQLWQTLLLQDKPNVLRQPSGPEVQQSESTTITHGYMQVQQWIHQRIGQERRAEESRDCSSCLLSSRRSLWTELMLSPIICKTQLYYCHTCWNYRFVLTQTVVQLFCSKTWSVVKSVARCGLLDLSSEHLHLAEAFPDVFLQQMLSSSVGCSVDSKYIWLLLDFTHKCHDWC